MISLPTSNFSALVVLLSTVQIVTYCQTTDLMDTVMEQYSDPHHGWRRMDGKIISNPVQADTRSLSNGQKKFIEFCAPCHGKSGLGDGSYASGLKKKPADLQKAARLKSDHHLYLQIEQGIQDMPRWKSTLNERDRWDIVNYINLIGKDL